MGLPGGVDLGQVAAVLIPLAAVTVLLRALPFSFVRALKGSPLIEFLGWHMPVGVMVVLVVYALLGAQQEPGGLAAGAAAAVFTLALHAWRRSPGLSIVAGTALYMLLVNLVW